MFNLDREIMRWRAQMAAGGIHAPEVLDEVESHLLDEVEQQLRAGLATRDAFEHAAQQVGQAALLKNEFDKIGGSRRRRVKRAMLTLAGIPHGYITTDMNSSTNLTNFEPRWVTYLKAGVFLGPALLLWAFSSIFVYPKLQWICQEAGVKIPTVYHLVNFLTQYTAVVCVVLALTVGLLEWRSPNWPRYRKATLGVGVFLLNSVILVLITMMVVLAIIAAPALLHHTK